jgi:hypothetical protein
MLPPLSNQPTGGDRVRHALAELGAGHSELQALVSGIFDRLDELADEFLGRKNASDQKPEQAEWESLQSQISQLTLVATELAESVANQKRLAARRNRRNEEEG